MSPLYAVKATDAFFINSRFKKNDLTVTAHAAGRLSAGGEFVYVKHDYLEDPTFFIAAPMVLSYDAMQFVFKPFVMPKTNDAYAYGGTLSLLLSMEQNNIDDKYTQAHIAVGFVNQNTEVLNNSGAEKKDFAEISYTLALRKNFFNAFVFGVNGTIFQYLNGVDQVQSIKSIFNHNDLANLNTYDTVYGLPKYSAGATFNRMLEKGANIYLAYAYSEYYTSVHTHSFIIGNDFHIRPNIKADLGYNHIIDGDNKKRDIFKIAASFLF